MRRWCVLAIGDIHTETELLARPDTGYALDNLDALCALVRGGRYRWLIGGHTHVPMVRTIADLTVINAGTLVLLQDPC